MLALIGALLADGAAAKVKLPQLFADGMVLQQQADAALWGEARPGAKVVIAPSWTKAKTVVTADADGRWKATVATPAAGGPYELTFNDGEKLTLKDILIGEVWLCSGQSNMEMPVRGFSAQPVEGSTDVILGARPEVAVRMCRIKRSQTLQPQDTCVATWFRHTPEGVAAASATGYFFAKYLHDHIDVPVGIIMSDWGGTHIRQWMPRELVARVAPETDLAFLDGDTVPKAASCTNYNGMLHPLAPYTIKGVLWYQGESDRTVPDRYRVWQKAFVEQLRTMWNNSDLPFYYVQIAPYSYGDSASPESALFREAQDRNQDEISHSGMVVTLDLGNEGCIHPAAKRQVGERLAMLALAKDYGFPCPIDMESPRYKGVTFADGKAVVDFEAGRFGLAPLGQELAGFEIAGADRVFHPAHAQVARSRRGVEVWSEEVPEPVAVRYAFHNYVEKASLFNNAGLPASSFRTDDW